jgi:L-2-hydroxyglutarate oxidase LhgO
MAGLGVHATIDLQGATRFGPDVEWLPVTTAAAPPGDGGGGGCDYDYTVDPARAAAFYGQVRRYWPALPDGALEVRRQQPWHPNGGERRPFCRTAAAAAVRQYARVRPR